MSNPKIQPMTKIRRKLTRVISLYQTHCGHEGLVKEATFERIQFETLVEGELKSAFERGLNFGVEHSRGVLQ